MIRQSSRLFGSCKALRHCFCLPVQAPRPSDRMLLFLP